MTNYPKVGWQSGQGPRLFPGLVQMDDGIEAAHQEIQALEPANVYLNIAGLKGQSGTADTDASNVLGYYTAGDGGGGLFRWSTTSTATDNGGTVIKPTSNPATGRWLRVLPESAEVRVAWFGARGDGTTDDTATIQAAIDYVSGSGGGVVRLDAKLYIADDLTLKSYTVLEGVRTDASEIRARPSSAAVSVFKIDPGPQLRMGLRYLTISANGNAGQHGLYFNAVAGAGGDGGIWYSVFDEIVVGPPAHRFSGRCIWFRGGTTSSQLPNQLCELTNVNCWHSGASGARALSLTGMCGQFIINGGEYEGVATTSGQNIEIGYELDGSGNPIGARSPYNIEFRGVTFQLASSGMVVNGTTEVALHSCYFESVQRAIRATNSTGALVVEGTNFSNAGSDGAGGGYVLSAENNAQVMFRDNIFAGAIDTLISVSSAHVEAGYNTYGNTTVSPTTSNMTRQLTAAATLDLGFTTTFLINTSATQVATITSGLFPGSRIHLRSWSGSVLYNQSGNISLGGRTSPLTVPTGVVATFVRMDLGGTWVLQSLSA